MKRSLGRFASTQGIPLSLLTLLLAGPIEAAPLSATIPNPAPIKLAWDYPTNALTTNLVFVLRGTTNVGQALPWVIEQSWPATNWWTGTNWTALLAGTNYTFKVTNNVVPGVRFWYVTATNFWGEESDPTNVLALDPLPARTANLKAERTW